MEKVLDFVMWGTFVTYGVVMLSVASLFNLNISEIKTARTEKTMEVSSVKKLSDRLDRIEEKLKALEVEDVRAERNRSSN